MIIGIDDRRPSSWHSLGDEAESLIVLVVGQKKSLRVCSLNLYSTQNDAMKVTQSSHIPNRVLKS